MERDFSMTLQVLINVIAIIMLLTGNYIVVVKPCRSSRCTYYTTYLRVYPSLVQYMAPGCGNMKGSILGSVVEY